MTTVAQKIPPAAPGLPEPMAPFADVRRIAVLRGGGLGDLVFALPAILALRDTYPEAALTLLGSAAHRVLLAGRGIVDAVEILPPVPGVGPGAGRSDSSDAAETAAFTARASRAAYDLGVQIHGGGANSNPFLLGLGVRHSVGTKTPDAEHLERTIPYEYYQHEVLRALEVVGLAGASAPASQPLLPVSVEERATATLLLGHRGGAPLVVLHPGASDPRRRWPASRFGEVADRLVASGARVVVVGDASDRSIADEVVEGVSPERSAGIRSLAGRLGLAELLGVLAEAELFVGNDSGPRHLAEAVGTRTASVFWYGNVITAGPLGRSSHRVAMSHRTTCPTCLRDITQVGWTAERCGHDDSVVADVGVAEVAAMASALLSD